MLQNHAYASCNFKTELLSFRGNLNLNSEWRAEVPTNLSTWWEPREHLIRVKLSFKWDFFFFLLGIENMWKGKMFCQNLGYIILLYFAFFFIAGIQDRKLKWPFAAQPTQQKDGTFRGLSSHVSKLVFESSHFSVFWTNGKGRKRRKSSFYKKHPQQRSKMKSLNACTSQVHPGVPLRPHLVPPCSSQTSRASSGPQTHSVPRHLLTCSSHHRIPFPLCPLHPTSFSSSIVFLSQEPSLTSHSK